MAISIECTHCHKRYNAPDSMAGKKVKCKHCGKVFAIPPAGNSTDAADPGSSAMGEDAATSGAPINFNKGGAAGGKLGNASAGYASKVSRKEDTEEIEFARPSGGGGMLRPSVPMDFPGASAIDGLAPVLMVVIGLGWLAYQAFSSNNTGISWVGPVRLIAYLGLCLGLAFPLGYLAINSTARKFRFMMPPAPALRALGAFSFPFALAMIMWLSGESFGMLIFGAIVGCAIVCAAVWFLFRIQPTEMSSALATTSGAFIGSIVLSYAILFGVNAAFAAVAAKSGTNQLTASPVHPTFAWDVPVANPEIKPRKVIASIPDTQESPSTAPSNTTIVNVNKLPDTTPPSTAPTDVQPSTAPSIVKVSPLTTAPSVPIVTTPNPPPTTTTTNTNVEAASQLVAKVTPLGNGGYTHVAFSYGQTPVVAAVKLGQTEELVEFYSGNPLAKKGETKFEPEPGIKQNYCVSPSGMFFARMVSFPKAGVMVWDINTGKDKLVPLDPTKPNAAVTPELLGFGFEDRLVIHWPGGGQPLIEVINHKIPQPQRMTFTVASFDRTPGNPIISPDGRQLALEAVYQGQAGIDLWDLMVYRKEPLKTCMPLRNDLTKPVGLAYGPMNTIAAYFEIQGKGILYSFKTTDAKPLHDEAGFGFRTLPYPTGAAETFIGRGLDYIDANDLLLLGRVLIDTETGKKLGDLGLDNPKAQRVVDKETLLIANQSADGTMQLLQVKLKPEQIAAERAKVRGTRVGNKP